jgi:hypothetical protein
MRGISEPPKRQLSGFAFRYKVGMVVVAAIGVSGAYFMWSHRMVKDTPFYIGIGALAGSVLLAVLFELYTFYRVRCPQCARGKLPRWKPNDAHGAPYHFYCGKCHVVWDTGMRHVAEREDRDDYVE